MVEFKSGDFRPYTTSTVLYGTVLYCTLRYGKVPVPYGTVRYRTGVQYGTVRYFTYDVRYGTVPYGFDGTKILGCGKDVRYGSVRYGTKLYVTETLPI